jgi:hypothetical protein
MKVLRIIGIVCLILSAVPTRAQLFEDKPKKQAKELFEKAMKEGNDRVGQIRDICQAFQLQPKDKKYSEACAKYRTALNDDDKAAFASAQLAYQSHDFEKAEALAKQVSSLDPKLSGQARSLIENIRNEKTSSQASAEIKAAWERGDFNTVMSLAQTMTTPAARATADIYVKDVNLYKEYIETANKDQKDNPQEAINQLGYAYNLNHNGPTDTKAKITELQNAIAEKNNSKYFQNQAGGSKNGSPNGTPGTTLSPENQKKLNGLLFEARNAEKQGNSALALSDFQQVLKIQPDNKEAVSSSARLQQANKTDPAAAANELKAAIRSFYQAQFDEARTALMDYLESPQTAQNPGAADFYLGAALIERSILRTPKAQWKGPSEDAITAFKAARKANYSPVRTYISPALLKIWDSIPAE